MITCNASQWDGDHDGKISQAELQAMLETTQLPAIDPSQPPQMIMPPSGDSHNTSQIMARCGLEPGALISRARFMDMVKQHAIPM